MLIYLWLQTEISNRREVLGFISFQKGQKVLFFPTKNVNRLRSTRSNFASKLLTMNDNEAMMYEILIRRAFNCQRGKKGGDADIFRALFREEYLANENPYDRKAQNAFEKRKQSVRNYLIKALEKGIARLGKKKDKIQAVTNLNELIEAINVSNNSNEFSNVISEAMELFMEHDISMMA